MFKSKEGGIRLLGQWKSVGRTEIHFIDKGWVIFQNSCKEKKSDDLESWHHSDLNQIVQLLRFLFPLSSFWIVLEATMTFFMHTKCISVLECCKTIPFSKSQLQKALSIWQQGQSCLLDVEINILSCQTVFFTINVSLICLYFLLGLHLIFRS